MKPKINNVKRWDVTHIRGEQVRADVVLASDYDALAAEFAEYRQVDAMDRKTSMDRVTYLEAEVARADYATRRAVERKTELEAALREAERALSVYARLPTNEYPGPPTTALAVVRAGHTEPTAKSQPVEQYLADGTCVECHCLKHFHRPGCSQSYRPQRRKESEVSDVKRYMRWDGDSVNTECEMVRASDYDALADELAATKEQLRLCNIDQFNAEARVQALQAVLRGIYPAAREILWCALVWNDHNFDWKTLLQHADLAAKQLGFDRLSGDPITAANKWMARIDAALGDSTLDRRGEHE